MSDPAIAEGNCRRVVSAIGGCVEIDVGCSVKGVADMGPASSGGEDAFLTVTLLPRFCVGNSSFDEPPWPSGVIVLLSAIHFGLAAAKSLPRSAAGIAVHAMPRRGERPREDFFATDPPT